MYSNSRTGSSHTRRFGITNCGLAQDCADESSTNLLRTCSSITLQGCSWLLQHSSFVLRYKQGDKEYGSRPQISSRDNSICFPLTAISEIYPCIMVTWSVDWEPSQNRLLISCAPSSCIRLRTFILVLDTKTQIQIAKDCGERNVAAQGRISTQTPKYRWTVKDTEYKSRYRWSFQLPQQMSFIFQLN